MYDTIGATYLEVGAPVSLPGEGVMLDVVLDRELVDKIDLALIEDLLVVQPDDGLVVLS